MIKIFILGFESYEDSGYRLDLDLLTISYTNKPMFMSLEKWTSWNLTILRPIYLKPWLDAHHFELIPLLPNWGETILYYMIACTFMFLHDLTPN